MVKVKMDKASGSNVTPKPTKKRQRKQQEREKKEQQRFDSTVELKKELLQTVKLINNKRKLLVEKMENLRKNGRLNKLRKRKLLAERKQLFVQLRKSHMVKEWIQLTQKKFLRRKKKQEQQQKKKKNNQKQKKNKSDQEQNAKNWIIEDLKNDEEQKGNDIPDITQCLICLEAVRSTIIIPCLHLIACVNCTRLLKKCPFCKLGIQAYSIYIKDA